MNTHAPDPCLESLGMPHPYLRTPPTNGADANARKDDAMKPRIALIPPGPLAEIVKVYEFGAGKYGTHNWKQGLPYSRWYNAIWRHVSAWWCGEQRDPESGLHHLAHAAFGLIALMYQEQNGTGVDDREEWQ